MAKIQELENSHISLATLVEGEGGFAEQLKTRHDRHAIWRRLAVRRGYDQKFLDRYRELFEPVKNLEHIHITEFEEHEVALAGMHGEIVRSYLQGVADGIPQKSYWIIDRPANAETGEPAERIYVEMNYKRNSETGKLEFIGGQEYRNLAPDHEIARWCEFWMDIYNDDSKSSHLFPEQSHVNSGDQP